MVRMPQGSRRKKKWRSPDYSMATRACSSARHSSRQAQAPEGGAIPDVGRAKKFSQMAGLNGVSVEGMQDIVVAKLHSAQLLWAISQRKKRRRMGGGRQSGSLWAPARQNRVRHTPLNRGAEASRTWSSAATPCNPSSKAIRRGCGECDPSATLGCFSPHKEDGPRRMAMGP